MQLETVARTHVGLVRSMNQDSILEIPENGVFLVADGMGGEKAGEEASAQVVATVQQKFTVFFEKSPTGASQLEGYMRDCLLSANRDVFQISVREPEKKGLGSTASLLCLHRGVYFAAQVGDSRIYLMRGGKIQQVTRDHTLVWALYEQGAITRDQLETHPDRHLLTQCIGNQKPIKVDTYMDQTQEGDVFLLCSDGLTGYAGEPKVYELLKEDALPLETRAELMIQAALDAGGGDNVSVILVRVTALEENDDWEPEATAPPARLTEEDTAGAFSTSVHRPVMSEAEARGDSARPRLLRWVAAAILLAGLALAIAYFMHRSGAVPVFLHADAATPGKITVSATADKTQLAPQQATETERGFRFLLPGPGTYSVEFTAPGFMPLSQTIAVEENTQDIDMVPLTWVRRPTLTLKLPPQAQITQVRLLPAAGAGLGDIVLEGEALKPGGNGLSIEVEPGVSYVAVVQAAGQADFESLPQQLQPGEARTLNVYFAEAGTAQ